MKVNWPPPKGMTIFKLFIFYFGSFLVPAGCAPFLASGGDEVVIAYLVFLAVYLPFLAWVWVRVTSWAMTIKPAPYAKLVSEEDLRVQLLSINGQDVPFVVHEDKHGGITATWNIVDAKWAELFSAHSIEMVSSVRLQFDAKNHTVRAQDASTSKSAVVDMLNGKAEFAYSFIKGIDMAGYKRGWRAGLIYKNGTWYIGEAHNFRFNIHEIKNPLIEMIGMSGWTYRPVPTFWRWWAG